MNHEVVLDAETGLPQVVASRSVDGQLTYRVHTVRSGGGSVFLPVTDAVVREMAARRHDPDEEVSFGERLREVAEAYARSLEPDVQGDLAAENERLAAEVEQERAARLAAEERLAAAGAPNSGVSEESVRREVATAARKATPAKGRRSSVSA